MKKQFIAAAALALGATAAFAPTAQADEPPTLADTVVALAAGGFDTNQNDFDIVTNALTAKDAEGEFLFPGLVTAAATDPDLTVFLPTDKAFRILVEDLYGISIKDEEALFTAIVETQGVDRVGEILAYHIVVGVQADADIVVNTLGDGAVVTTANGPITLEFKGKKPQIRLVDIAGPGRDPIVRSTDLDLGSNAIGHVIDRVLIPG